MWLEPCRETNFLDYPTLHFSLSSDLCDVLRPVQVSDLLFSSDKDVSDRNRAKDTQLESFFYRPRMFIRSQVLTFFRRVVNCLGKIRSAGQPLLCPRNTASVSFSNDGHRHVTT